MEPTTQVPQQVNTGKWGAIRDVLTSANGVLLLFLLMACIVLLIYAVRKGWVSFKGHGLIVGNGESERNIIRQQVEWTHVFLESFVSDFLNNDPTLDEWRTRYIIEKVYDEVVDWITFNHITDKGDYIKIKQEKIWYLVKSLTVKGKFRTSDFRVLIDETVQTIILHLIKIRLVYSKKFNVNSRLGE